MNNDEKIRKLLLATPSTTTAGVTKMNSFEILKREIAECRIRAKSNETIQVLSHLQEFAENNLNNGWISVDDKLPKPEENYYEYDFEPKKFYLVQLKDGYIDTVSFLIDEEHHPYFESCSLYNKDGSYRVQERGFTEYNVSEVKYWQVFPQPPKE